MKSEQGGQTDRNIHQSISLSYYYRGLSKIEIKEVNSACADFEKAAKMGNNEAILEQNKYCKK